MKKSSVSASRPLRIVPGRLPILCAAALTVPYLSTLHAVDGTWNVNATGVWSAPGNWAGSAIADGAGSLGDFSQVNLTGNRTVTIDTTSRTLGILSLGDTDGTNGYLINASGGASLFLDNGLSNAQINQISTSFTNTISAPVTLNSSLTVNNASVNALTISGIVGGSGKFIENTGSGQLALNGANTFDGGVFIRSGTVSGGNAASFGTGTVSLGNTSGSQDATLEATGGGKTFTNAIHVVGGHTGIATLANNTNTSMVFSGNVRIDHDLRVANGGTGAITLGGALQGTGDLIASGATGRFTLSGNNGGFQGDVFVNSGTLTLTTISSLNLENTVYVNSGAIFDRGVDGSSSTNAVNLAGLNDGVGGGGIVQKGSTTGTRHLFLGGSDAYSFSGTIQDGPGTGRLALSKGGSGTQTLSGANTYSGATTVLGGTLHLDFAATGAPASNIVNSGSNASDLNVGGGNLSLTGKASTVNAQQFNGLTVSSGASAIELNANAVSNPLALNLGAITRSAGGTIDFTLPTGTQNGSNGILTSTTTLANGVLVSAASNGVAYATVGGSTWATLSGSNIVGLSSYSVGVPNYLAANNVDVTDGDSVTGVTVNTLRFNSAGTDLTLSGGVNSIATGGLLVTSAASNATIAGSGTLRATGGNQMVIVNNGGLTVGSVIANNGGNTNSLTVSGTGRTTMNAAHTYTGATIINRGVLETGQLANGGVASGIGASAATAGNLVLNGGTLRYIGAAVTIDRNYTLGPNGGTFDASGSGALTITGSSSVISTSQAYAGGSQILTLAGTNAGLNTLSGVISNGSGANVTNLTGLAKDGSGTWVVSGNNTYSGVTTITAGTLLVNGSHTTAGAYNVVGGVFGGTGTITTVHGAGISLQSGAKLSPGNSAGVLTADLGTGVFDLSGAVGGANVGALVFELGTTSDMVLLTSGTLNIGAGILEFEDFDFTALSGFGPGSYTLFDTSSTIAGSLGSSLSGTVGGYSATVAISGNDLVLNVVPEPAGVLLCGLGLAAVLWRSRRR